MKRLALAGLLAMGALLFFGCQEAEDAVNCYQICDRYRSCFDDQYDTGKCEDRCRDEANRDQGYSHDANVCEACLDDESCVDSVFHCTDNCSGIVP